MLVVYLIVNFVVQVFAGKASRHRAAMDELYEDLLSDYHPEVLI